MASLSAMNAAAAAADAVDDYRSAELRAVCTTAVLSAWNERLLRGTE